MAGERGIWDELDTQAYFEQNYRELHPEDARILEEEAAIIPRLGIAPYSLTGQIIEIGCDGDFQYPVMQYLVADTGFIRYTEYGTPGFKKTESTLNEYWHGGLEGKPVVWKKFGDFLLNTDPRFGFGPNHEYVHPTERALRLGTPAQESVYELPVGVFDGGVSNFCLDSITNKEDEWLAATECFVRSIKRGGPVVLTCMNLSENYDVVSADGTTRTYPAYPITSGGINDRLRELGVRSLRSAVIDDVEKGARPVGEDGTTNTHYDAMSVHIGIAA